MRQRQESVMEGMGECDGGDGRVQEGVYGGERRERELVRGGEGREQESPCIFRT